VLQPLVPGKLLRLLEELLVLGRHGRPPPPPPLERRGGPPMQSPSADRCGGLGFQIVAVAFVGEFGSEWGKGERERRVERHFVRRPSVILFVVRP
jgi:hypothetical protein